MINDADLDHDIDFNVFANYDIKSSLKIKMDAIDKQRPIRTSNVSTVTTRDTMPLTVLVMFCSAATRGSGGDDDHSQTEEEGDS